MNALIKIKEQDNKQVVSARELHEFLGSKKDFSSWIKTRIDRYGFKENEDFVMLTQSGEQSKSSRGGHNKIDYVLTVDCAKELSMVEGTEKGRQARAYFIDCEKKLKVKQEKIEQSQIKEKVVVYMKPLTAKALGFVGGKLGMTRSEIINAISVLFLDKMNYPLCRIDKNYVNEINNLHRAMAHNG